MKLPLCLLILLPLVLAFSSTAGHEALLDSPADDELVYYYIDHSCSCSPTAVLPTDQYWILTSTIYAAEIGDLDQLVAQYKRFLERQYSSPEAMAHDVVIRYQKTQAMAHASRAHKIEKMRSRGYTILEAAFTPVAESEDE